jgi:adenosylcobinamide-GDP ribazoletransferase
MKKILIAFQFLTIIPVRVNEDISEKEISQSAVYFPVAGAFQGLSAVCTALLSVNFFSPEITSGLVLLTFIVINGGFHLDGLADTFDALAIKSSGDPAADRDKKLGIMKDSTTGAIGVIAIVMAILLKFLFLADILSSSPASACYVFLFLMPVFSKWVMISMMYHGKSARQDGLGKMFIDNITLVKVAFASLLLIFFCVAADLLYLRKLFGSSAIILYLLLIAVLYIFSFLSTKFFEKRFGGLTGDTFGAVSEISEILFLMVTSLWLQHFI